MRGFGVLGFRMSKLDAFLLEEQVVWARDTKGENQHRKSRSMFDFKRSSSASTAEALTVLSIPRSSSPGAFASDPHSREASAPAPADQARPPPAHTG